MDNNSWRIKFDSTLPSSMTSMASSSASPERRNQMEMNSGQYFHQYATQDSSSALHERRHDSLPPNYSNLNSHKSNHSEMENSFLALLSGLPSLLQCDFRELSSQKVSNAARSVNINDFESEIPRTSGALLSENLSNKNTQNEANCSFVPYRLVSSSSSSSVSVLHGSLHASNINLQTLGLAKVVNHHMLPSIEKVKDFATLKGDCCGTSSGKAGIPYRKDIQLSLKIPEESNSSISNQSLPILSRCPHMFCLGTAILPIIHVCITHLEWIHAYKLLQLLSCNSIQKLLQPLGLKVVFLIGMCLKQQEHWMVMFL
ncbi:uncharacterized protein LOC111304066 isoform X3 [Durio zibethinus]|uniref:Uncharacterized protein LOC111304066 isoform X3 n=1 Tax=Durio zibethinus TaxID=66656 RepID=A0A6P5ZU39_DURZI|nr:uncharacterized protein LOC111304066 isoform X3 [Durio zibethinus]